MAKSDFDHSLIRTWDDVDRLRGDIIKYCTNDVLSLEFIFKKFSSAMWEISNIHLHSSSTIASHAYAIWRTMTDSRIVEGINLPNEELYSILRQCYFGGRVLPVQARYDNDISLKEDDFDEFGVYLNTQAVESMTDYLKMVDVVSLYPSVMLNEALPHGKVTFISYAPGSDAEETMRLRLNLNRPKIFKEMAFRGVFKVDVTCPKDIYVPYLMTKDSEGKNQQDLLDKVGVWYAGPDLWEAIRIGYRVTRVHACYIWERLQKCFDDYITKVYSIKERFRNDKTNAMYTCAKLLMNSLSGKFGQKDSEEETFLFKGFDSPFEEKNLSRMLDFEMFDDGVMATLSPPPMIDRRKHATQISVFILAHARRKMSKMLWAIGGYTDRNRCFLYTDTDSMILRKEAFESIPKKYIGHSLGQLEDEFPNGYIISARFLAPKTYTLTLLSKTDAGYVLKVKTRCKGIPHRGDVFEPRSYTNEQWFVCLDPEKPVDLKGRWYTITSLNADDEDEEDVEYVPFLSVPEYEDVLSGTKQVQVIYGSLEKNFPNGDGGRCVFKIRTQYRTRSLALESWWSKGKRVIQEDNPMIDRPTLALGQQRDYLLNEWAEQAAEYVNAHMDISDE